MPTRTPAAKRPPRNATKAASAPAKPRGASDSATPGRDNTAVAKRGVKPAASKRGAKPAASRRGAKPPSKAPSLQPVAADASADPSASLRDLAARLGKLELAGLAGKLIEGWRQDIEAIVQARQRYYEGLQTVVRRQTAQLKDAVGEWRSVAKLVTVIGPKDSISQLDSLVVAAFELALKDIRELSELAASSHRDAFDILRQRVNTNVDQVSQLLHR